MDQNKFRLAVIGAGAIGGVIASRLASANSDLQIACKHADTASIVRETGVRVFGLGGESRTRLNAVASIDDLQGPLDIVFLATKAMDAVAAARELLPLLTAESAVVSLQNGISEDDLASVLGPERVVGCVVGWGATMHAPAELEITSPGEFVIGEWGLANGARAELLRGMLSTVVPARVSDNIRGELYSKLIVNSCINSLGALTGQRLGELLASKKARDLFTGVMREAMAVAAALEIQVEPGGGGKLDYYKFLDDSGFLSDLRRHLLVRLVGLKYRRIKSSSLQSLQRGRPSEIGYLNGYICRQGAESEMPTPLNQAIVDLVAEIEAGRRPITPDNLGDPALAGV